MTDTSKIYAEVDRYYDTFNPDTERMAAFAEKILENKCDKSSLVLKTEITEMICEKAKLHLFKNLPFFFEFSCGRNRYDWGGLRDGTAGRIMADKCTGHWLSAYADEMRSYYENGYVHGWDNPVGFDHHCLGYDTLLGKGLFGIIKDIRKKQRTEKDEEKLEFYYCAVNSLIALCELAQRFCEKAISLSKKCKDRCLREYYLEIAKAANNVPMNPPDSFYEALCCIVFCREAIGSLEGIGISTFGHLDRLLYPYYEKDIKDGKITKDEALHLIKCLLMYTEARFAKKTRTRETSTTIVLGGCDADGKAVFNELTKMILGAVLEERTHGTKLICRISSEHPDEYINCIASVQAANIPTLVVENDESHIASRVKHGQDVRDARLYVAGGCHETVLANTEVSTRADTWMNPTRVLLDTMKKDGFSDFDAFYREFLSDYAKFYTDVCNIKNKYEAMWKDCCPYPLYSATIDGCVESGRDLTEGGAKYSTTALSHLGTATLADSLYSIKKLVFEEKKITLSEFVHILSENFDGNDELRRYIIKKIPKYGTANAEVDDFSAKLLSDFAKNLPKLKNARGGDYMPAFYPHDLFKDMGQKTGATPDGRLSGTALSRGCSPSEFIENASPLDIFHSIKSIDFTNYTDSFCCEITIPRMQDEITGRNVVSTLIKAFLNVGGSTLQINMLDKDMLLLAKAKPQEHQDLIVRICGYSERFVALNENVQDEIISRAVRS